MGFWGFGVVKLFLLHKLKTESRMDGDINPSSGNNHPSNEQANGEGRFIKPALRKKLFRLKTIGPLQDTEENNDGSQLKVRRLSLFNWINASCLIFNRVS